MRAAHFLPFFRHALRLRPSTLDLGPPTFASQFQLSAFNFSISPATPDSRPSRPVRGPLSRVQRAAHAQPGPVHHMRVDLCRRHINMPQQILDAPDVHPALQQVRREAPAEEVEG